MKKSSRMKGISIILWFGLGIGLASAATTIAISKDNEMFAALGNHNVSVAMVGMDDASAANGSGIAVFKVNNAAGVHLDSANTKTAAGVTTNTAALSNTAKPIRAESASIQAPGSMGKAAGHAVDAGNSPQIPAHQFYAMLLVGLGMLFFSARHRSNTI